MERRLSYVWDYAISGDEFDLLLAGKLSRGRLNRRWALTRLFDYAPYEEIVRRLGYKGIVDSWPEVRDALRSESRRRGLDFLVRWLNTQHPELLDLVNSNQSS